MSIKGYKCPSCGGNLVFNSDTQKLQCPSCGNEIDMDEIQQCAEVVESSDEQEDTNEGKKDSQEDPKEWEVKEVDGKVIYTCPSCGGEVEADQTTAATKCPYCDSPLILPGQVSGEFRPDLIIPFQLDDKDAKEAYQKFCKGKRLLPKMFQSDQRLKEIKGIYVPFWLYNCKVEGSMKFDAQKTKTWRDSDYEYTKTDFYLVTRYGEVYFEHVPVDGSAEMADEYMESIEPFEIDQAVPFQEGYLSGYEAIKYDQSRGECWDRAEKRIDTTFADVLRNSVNTYQYSSISSKGFTASYSNIIVKYVLMPVWVLNVKYKDKMYHFAMNGQTGKMTGILPIDWKLFWKYTLGIFAGSSLITYILMLIFLL